MLLADILSENWKRWAAGGLEAGTISTQLTDNDDYSLQRWIADNAPEAVSAGLSIKDIVDLATWAVHGTHTLLHYPREIQEARISETAKTFRLAPSSLASLYRHAGDLLPTTRA